MPKKSLQPADLLVSYALSRCGKEMLKAWGCSTQLQAFAHAGEILDTKASSIKLLRDEFDAITSSSRRGWRNREPRAHITAVASQLDGLSDGEVVELANAVLAGRELDEVYSLIERAEVFRDTASQLETGRRAEAFFVGNSQLILGADSGDIIDCTMRGCGYDCEATGLPRHGIEVKGLRESAGSLLFTEREFRVAREWKERYVLCVVCSLDSSPTPAVVHDPVQNLSITMAPPQPLQNRYVCNFRP